MPLFFRPPPRPRAAPKAPVGRVAAGLANHADLSRLFPTLPGVARHISSLPKAARVSGLAAGFVPPKRKK